MAVRAPLGISQKLQSALSNPSVAIKNMKRAARVSVSTTHLQELEAEAIHALREAAAVFRKPVILYSIGKDSSVLMHLAMKAFYPAKPPFSVLHVDTRWKFR